MREKGSIQKIIYMYEEQGNGTTSNNFLIGKQSKPTLVIQIEGDLIKATGSFTEPTKRLKKMTRGSGQLSISQIIVQDRYSYKATTTGTFSIKYKLLVCWTLTSVAIAMPKTSNHLFFSVSFKPKYTIDWASEYTEHLIWLCAWVLRIISFLSDSSGC